MQHLGLGLGLGLGVRVRVRTGDFVIVMELRRRQKSSNFLYGGKIRAICPYSGQLLPFGAPPEAKSLKFPGQIQANSP